MQCLGTRRTALVLIRLFPRRSPDSSTRVVLNQLIVPTCSILSDSHE